MIENKCVFCSDVRDDLVYMGSAGYESVTTGVPYWACPEGTLCYEDRHMTQDERSALLRAEFLARYEQRLTEQF